jgi:hypothetical protein
MIDAAQRTSLAGSEAPERNGPANQTDTLDSMLATLCCYEQQFGPNSPVTLRLMAEVGAAFGRRGEIRTARTLLERASRDLTRFLGADHPAAVEARTRLAWISANGPLA